MYEQVSYPQLVHPQTHPDRLAVVGQLLGMKPAAVDRCRVLEVGCGPATNLIAMADALPDAHFTGIDASPAHVRRAGEIIAKLELRNVCVLEQDIRSFRRDGSRFDFVIAHGVYSWVDAEVRSALLRLVRENLADHGIAFVSYNTFPGWYLLRAIRDMMLFHGRHETDPLTRVVKAREMLAFLLHHLDPQSSLYAANLAAYRLAMEERSAAGEAESAASLLHDELAPVNEPLFFHEFASAAAGSGLQYVAEADLRGSTSTDVNPAVVQELKTLASDLISLEQYLDFLTNRQFRQTLLCRHEVQLSRTVRAGDEALREFYVSSRAAPATDEKMSLERGALRLATEKGREFSTDHRLSKAALMMLSSAFPQSLAWPELVRHASMRVQGAGYAVDQRDRDLLGGNLLRAFAADRSLVALSSTPDRFVPTITDRPVAGGVARLLAGEGRRTVPNRKHERVTLSPVAARLVPYLDGTRNLDDLRGIHGRLMTQPVSGPHTRDEDGGTFESLMAFLARSALLEA